MILEALQDSAVIVTLSLRSSKAEQLGSRDLSWEEIEERTFQL